MATIADAALRHVDAELWLVGDGEGMQAVRARLADREADGQVRRLGVRLDLEYILPQIDALLVTSQAESFCLVALEGMAAGVPVVAPRVGGVPELVEHNSSGLLFGSDDVQAIRYLTCLMSDAGWRRQMGQRARTRALAFAATAVVPRYEQLYAKVLSRTTASAPLPYLV